MDCLGIVLCNENRSWKYKIGEKNNFWYYTDWFIGILVTAYYSSYIPGKYTPLLYSNSSRCLVIAHRSTKKKHSTLRVALALGSGLQKGAWDWWVKTDSEKILEKKPGTDPPRTPKSSEKNDFLQKKQVLKGPRVCSRGMLDCLREASQIHSKILHVIHSKFGPSLQ